MKTNVSVKKYKLNKMKFIRFIGLIIFSIVVIFMILFNYNTNRYYGDLNNSKMIKETTNNTFSNESINNVYTENTIDTNENLVVTNDEVIIDYSKKPEKLNSAYYECIVNVSHDENIPMEVILAIITTENENYDIYAAYKNTNGTIDMGLCQVNSAYVSYYEDFYKIENFDPYNVQHAILFIVKHIKYLSNYGKDNFNLVDMDSYIFAAGAYNRGLNAECEHRNMYDYKEKFINNYEKFN